MIFEDLQLQAVRQFIDLDLEGDRELLEIIELAAAATNMPYAIASFLANETSHLEVRHGVSETTVLRNLNFCIHAAKHDELFIVTDVLLDRRFADNSLIEQDSEFRFFAGMPLVTRNGDKVGALCVLDTKPRSLDDHQQLILAILAKQVMKIVELRAGIQLLEQSQAEVVQQKQLIADANNRLRSFFESSANFQVLLGKHGDIIDFNKTAFNFIKAVHKVKIIRGDQFIKYLAPEFVATFIKHYNQALLGQKSLVDGSTVYDEMGVIYWEAAFEAARDENDEIIGMSYLIRNVTERKLKEQKILSQNASLLKIAHIQAHELRAPLASIMGLMGLIKEDNYEAPKEYLQLLEQAVEAFDTTIKRIMNDIDHSVIPEFVADSQ